MQVQQVSSALEELPWLPRAPADFRARCSAFENRLAESPRDAALDCVRQLANHALDINQLTRLSRCVARCLAVAADENRLRVALLSNATTAMIAPALSATAARYGLLIEVPPLPFDQVMQQAADPGSTLYQARPDVVLIALDHHALSLGSGWLQGRDSTEDALRRLDLVLGHIRKHCSATIVVQSVPAVVERIFGSYDCHVPHSTVRAIQEFNLELARTAPHTGARIVDAAGIAAAVGLERWHDPAHWYSARIPFHPRFIPLYCEHIARMLAALRGKTRKCLVLDLDDTIWGGVAGDDGISGLVLGAGSPRGEAHLQIQKTALQLRARGILLAVCSKNDESVARRTMREHPEMLLREDHIAAWQVNWNRKSANLHAIAAALCIGTDALVLLDDNPVEREEVRRAVPQVAVPEMPRDPAWVPRTLLAAGYFEALAFSHEDRHRADYYRSVGSNSAEQRADTGIESYLESLNMVLSAAAFTPVDRARITQLINKTNQFNLTTRRRTDEQVAALEQDPGCFTLQARLRDRFGDNGIIAVLICQQCSPMEWEIDTWLMSCRILNRGVEYSLCNLLVSHAAQRAVQRIHGVFRPSGRNELVRDLLGRLGFTKVAESASEIRWQLQVDAYVDHPTQIVTQASGGAHTLQP